MNAISGCKKYSIKCNGYADNNNVTGGERSGLDWDSNPNL